MGDSLFVHGGVTSALEARLALAGLLALHGPGALDVRTGVLHGPGTTALVTGTAATAPMQVAIGVHDAVLSRGAANGPYLMPTETVQLVNIGAAPASGTRIDVVYEKQQDNTPGVPTPDGTAAPLYGVLAGTVGAGKPDLATAPGLVGALELATVAVSAGATSTLHANVLITQTARQTAARGGPIPCRNQAERDELVTTPRAGYPGLHVKRLDLGGVIQRWVTGTTWESYVSASEVARSTGTLTPAAGWGPDPAYYTPSYHLSADGKVTLRGRLLRTGAAVTLGSVPSILTVPAAIQPASAIAPDTYVGIGGPPALAYMARLNCASPFTTMTVSDLAGSGGTFNTSSGYVSLDGVSWWL